MSASPIVTDGFLFTPSLIVTHGFGDGAIPPIVVPLQRGGAYQKKDRKQQRPVSRFEDRPVSAKHTLMEVMNRMKEEEARLKEEEEIMQIIKGYFE